MRNVNRCSIVVSFLVSLFVLTHVNAELLDHPGTGNLTEGWDGPGQGSVTVNWFLGWNNHQPGCAVNTTGVTTDGGVSFSQVETQVKQAMATWASVADVRFNKVGDSTLPGKGCLNDPNANEFDCDANPDTIQLNIYWGNNEHCHPAELSAWWFDGAWNPSAGNGFIFAHAWGPYDILGGWNPVFGGNIHLDDGENWVTSNPSNIVDEFNTTETSAFVDIQTEVLHELGHSLGLAHTNSNNAVMNPYKWNLSRRTLTQHDRDTLLSIYRPARQHPGVVLLFDLSGSMNWDFNGTSGVPEAQKRLTLAKNAALPFMALLNAYGDNFAEFAIADFRKDAGQCIGHTQSGMTLASAAAVQVASNNTIPGLTASGGTPLLAGLDHARSLFTDHDRKAIILLSDGYHNCPSSVQAGDQVVTDSVTQLTNNNILVYPIGFGRPEDFDSALLTRLGDETGGEYYAVTGADFDPSTWNPTTALQNAYKAILVDALGLEVAVDPLAMIQAGETHEHDVHLTKYDDDVGFMLSWATSSAKRMSLNLISSDGLPVPSTENKVIRRGGNNFSIVTVKNSFLKQPGKISATPWKMVVRGGGLKENEKEPYQYSVLLRSSVQLRPQITAAQFNTGEKLLITAALVENNRAIAKNADVTVKITRPEEGRGNFFAKNILSPAELAKAQTFYPDKGLSPLALKTIALTKFKNISLPGRVSENEIKLYDDGTHGDKRGGDGIYSAEYANTQKPGVYDFSFIAKSQTKSGQVFTREAKKQIALAVKMSNTHTITSSNVINGNTVVNITPKDTSGNHLGPGYAGTINIKVDNGETVGAVEDNLDGSYSQTIKAESNAIDPVVTIVVGDEKVNVVVVDSNGGDSIMNYWLLIFLLLLIILILVVVIKNKSN